MIRSVRARVAKASGASRLINFALIGILGCTLALTTTVWAVGVPQPTETIRPASLSHKYHAKYHTIAHEILDDEVALGIVDKSMFDMLDNIVDWSIAAVPARTDSQYANLTHDQALAVLTAIDKVLYTHGFVYPGYTMGWVDLLSDGLTPRTLYAAEVTSIEDVGYNDRRLPDIKRIAPGPFYLVDCDIASFPFLGVGDALKMPIAMVNLPDHDFIRWNLGNGHFLDFETMTGQEIAPGSYDHHGQTPESVKAGLFMSSWTREQTLGYHAALLAGKWSSINDYVRERDVGLYATALYPTLPDAWNAIAWAGVMSDNQAVRRSTATLVAAKKAVATFEFADNLDTLACAYAEMGDWVLALRTEQRAASAYNDFPNATDYSKYFSDFTPPHNRTCYVARSPKYVKAQLTKGFRALPKL